jgi:hypothetical protein
MYRAAGGSRRLGDLSVDGSSGVAGCPQFEELDLGQIDDGFEGAVIGVAGTVPDLHGDGQEVAFGKVEAREVPPMILAPIVAKSRTVGAMRFAGRTSSRQ